MDKLSATPSSDAWGHAHEGWIDFARAVCAVGVVLLHCFSGFAEGNPVPYIGEFRMVLWTALELVFGRFAVPVFFMLTGWLLLDEKRSMSLEKLGRYALRIAALILIFGYPMNLIELMATSGSFTFGMLIEAFTRLLMGLSWGHMWYLYTLLGCYLIVLPVRAFAQQSSKETYRTFLVMLGITTLCLPTLVRLFELSPQLANYIPISCAAPFYLLLGDYQRRFVHEPKSKITAVGVFSLVVCLVFATAYIYSRKSASYALEDYANPLIALWALCMFQFFRFGWRTFTLTSGAVRAIRFVSSNSLGLYITHPVLLNALYKGLSVSPISSFFGSFIIFWVLALAFGLVCSHFLRRIPFLRKLL